MVPLMLLVANFAPTGSEGHLKIVVPSQLIDKDIELWVPFKLAPCPFGFNNPTSYSPPTGDSVSIANSRIIHVQYFPY